MTWYSGKSKTEEKVKLKNKNQRLPEVRREVRINRWIIEDF